MDRVHHSPTSATTSRPPSDPGFFDRALDRIDPHREPWDAGLWYVQLICGRWLALRRMKQNLSVATLAAFLKLDPQILCALEEGSGLVVADGPTERTWTRLAARLAFEPEEEATVGAIISYALGQVAEPDLELVDRLVAELERLEPPIAAAPTVPRPALVEAVPLDDDIFALLGLLVGGPRHSIALADAMKKDSPTINGLLVRLMAEEFITREGQRIDPDIDPDLPLTYYRITAKGQQAYASEQLRRERQALAPGLPSTKFAPGG